MNNFVAIYGMPSSSIQDKAPHSVVFPNEPLFPIPRGFDSTCFAHDLILGLGKLSACAVKCVFLMYLRV